MQKSSLWSLRLGFSNQQSSAIESLGLDMFLKHTFDSNFNTIEPEFLANSPKNIKELRERRKNLKASSPEQVKEMVVQEAKISNEMKAWWIDKMMTEKYPLREKMTCFWHNHFVATFQKVKVNHWIFDYNQMLRENAFGNFKELTKKVLKSNAMVRYLDNVDNKKGSINENLSRELLELFTLGIGNYTEEDIKNGAKALAGLGIGEKNATYRPIFEDNDTITYLGKTGKFKADDLVDIIFEQKNIPYLITKKILQWFIYDDPKEALIKYYGNFFKKVNFEIQPLLTKIFTEEFAKENAGSKIKNPLEFILQLVDALQIDVKNKKAIVFFLKEQGMDLFNQANVKGWEGGKTWLTSQIYLQRQNVCDLVLQGKTFNRRAVSEDKENETMNLTFVPKLNWKGNTNKEIILYITDRFLYIVDENNQKDFEAVLKYDFNPEAQNANQAVLRLFNTITKTPEFQLI